MTEITLETLNALKRAHAETILAAMDDLRATIASEDDLWFGGLPPILVQLDHFLTAHAARTRDTFGIVVAPPEPPSEPED